MRNDSVRDGFFLYGESWWDFFRFLSLNCRWAFRFRDQRTAQTPITRNASSDILSGLPSM